MLKFEKFFFHLNLKIWGVRIIVVLQSFLGSRDLPCLCGIFGKKNVTTGQRPFYFYKNLGYNILKKKNLKGDQNEI